MSNWLGRAILLAAVLTPATFLHAALPTPGAPAARGSLAGQLLIATPAMGDARFDHTVILLVQHSQDGALGLIINRPVGEQPLTKVLEILGQKADAITGTVRVFAGGPVQPGIGFVIHSTDYRKNETVSVDENVAVTSTPEILRDMGHNKGPKKAIIAFGYAGWAGGQLEDEIQHGAWYMAPDDPALIFDEDREKVWERAMAHRTQDL
ncbi:MAG TPA: YqgE/AlgH family protein [Xanthobacteraceae bacterium]|nr:YqgE/AlgH family protein [Xanthobacteraceae bacterium]